MRCSRYGSTEPGGFENMVVIAPGGNYPSAGHGLAETGNVAVAACEENDAGKGAELSGFGTRMAIRPKFKRQAGRGTEFRWLGGSSYAATTCTQLSPKS